MSGTTSAQDGQDHTEGYRAPAQAAERGQWSPPARIEISEKLKVALDLRDLPAEQVGTRTYAVNLARELYKLPDLELTLLVQNHAQAKGMHGRVVSAEAWADDVEVIHKPAQVMGPAELRLLFESSAQLVITYQDLIAFRIPLAFASETTFDTYRATSRLMLPAVQKVIAYSRSAKQEIASEFGIPLDEIPVVMLATENESASVDRRRRARARLPKRYFFSLASDYPHKNLPNLLDAYSRLRARWKKGQPPQLVLAGYSSGARSGLYPQLERAPAPDGVVFLGPVPQHQLVDLYKNAQALVFASLYEGFGLPPLEALALGTPVIAMAASAMPEVCGDAVLYAEGYSAESLSVAMERLASDPALRNELRQRGFERVRNYSWEKTAKATSEVYRSAVLHPCDRSLRTRRILRDVIIDWSAKSTRHGAGSVAALGIREACGALQSAFRTRLRREFKRLRQVSARKL